MEDAEYCHFNAEQHGRNSDSNVGCLDARGCFDDASGGDTGDEELYNRVIVGYFGWVRLDRLTVCQNERKMTSLIATTLRSGLCSARSPLSWM